MGSDRSGRVAAVGPWAEPGARQARDPRRRSAPLRLLLSDLDGVGAVEAVADLLVRRHGFVRVEPEECGTHGAAERVVVVGAVATQRARLRRLGFLSLAVSWERRRGGRAGAQALGEGGYHLAVRADGPALADEVGVVIAAMETLVHLEEHGRP